MLAYCSIMVSIFCHPQSSHRLSSPSLECRLERCSGPDLDVYSLYFVTRPVLPQLRLSCQLHSSVAAVNSAILVAGNVLEIVPLDPVVHEVLGDVVDDLDLLSEQDRQSTLVGDSCEDLR